MEKFVHEEVKSGDQTLRILIRYCIDQIVEKVQNKVCNENQVLGVEAIGLGDRLKEVPVWGIDSHTRRMIELVIEDCFKTHKELIAIKNPVEDAQEFIERALLPSINLQESVKAHDMQLALNYILEVEYISIL